MSGGYLALLKKKVPLNNLLHDLRTPLFVGKKRNADCNNAKEKL